MCVFVSSSDYFESFLKTATFPQASTDEYTDDGMTSENGRAVCMLCVCVWTRVCVNVSFTDGRSLKEISLASLPYDEHRQNIPIPWRNKQLR